MPSDRYLKPLSFWFDVKKVLFNVSKWYNVIVLKCVSGEVSLVQKKFCSLQGGGQLLIRYRRVEEMHVGLLTWNYYLLASSTYMINIYLCMYLQ